MSGEQPFKPGERVAIMLKESLLEFAADWGGVLCDSGGGFRASVRPDGRAGFTTVAWDEIDWVRRIVAQ